MKQIKIRNPMLQREVARSSSKASRARPADSDKWTGSDSFIIKPTLEQGTNCWLGFEWGKANGGSMRFPIYPTVG